MPATVGDVQRELLLFGGFAVARNENDQHRPLPEQCAVGCPDALQERFARQTKLIQVPENGDLNFEGEITNYASTPAAISGDEYAVLNNLTITVRVRFTNAVDPSLNFDKTFSAFSTYESSKLLQEVEPTLIPEIVDQLVEDIFNAAVSNWQ